MTLEAQITAFQGEIDKALPNLYVSLIQPVREPRGDFGVYDFTVTQQSTELDGSSVLVVSFELVIHTQSQNNVVRYASAMAGIPYCSGITTTSNLDGNTPTYILTATYNSDIV